MDFDVYGIISKDSFGIKLLKKVLSIPSVNSSDSFYEIDGIKYKYAVFSRSLGDVFNSRVLKKNNQIKDSKEVAEDLFDKIKDNEFDIIHAHGMYEPPAGLVAKLLSQKLSVPYVVTCHGSDINLAMPKAKDLYVDVLENASKVIFVSNALLNKAKSFGYTGENSVVIPNGIEPDIFKPLDKVDLSQDSRQKKVGKLYNSYKSFTNDT